MPTPPPSLKILRLSFLIIIMIIIIIIIIQYLYSALKSCKGYRGAGGLSNKFWHLSYDSFDNAFAAESRDLWVGGKSFLHI